MPVFALYNFDDADTTARDSALGNGAQNGVYLNGATAAAGQAVLDGDNDLIKIYPDPAFQLDRGTLDIAWTMGGDPLSSAQTLLSRDSSGTTDGGYRIEILANGSVVISHETATGTQTFGTAPGFANPGDSLNLSYSWDQGGAGGQLIINNTTTGGSFADDVPNTLSMDMSGQGINQPWMIGAGQATSSPNLLNNVDQHFQGSVSMFQLSDTVDNGGGDPDANPDTATTAEDTAVTIPVLGNDTDPTGQPLTVTSADAPNGTVTVNPNGTITYTPDPNYNGPDTITYTVTDPDGNTSTSTVTVTVTPVNDAPEANPDTSTTPFNTPVTFAVLGNDTDVDGDTLTISGTPTSPNGTVTVNPNGTLTFTPTPGFTGAAVVNYTIVDEEGLTDTSTWTITVGSGAGTPTANPDTATTAEDTPVTIPVLGNDTDPTGQPLTVTSADAPNGTVTVNPNGTITYTPDPNYNGPDTITYTVTDPDGNTSTSTVTVTVTPVNDAPEANPDTSTTPFNTPVTFAVLGNDTDVDGDTLTISGTPTSPNGTVTVNPNGTLTFTPTPGFTGAAVVNYTIVDEEGLTDTSTWTITVGSGAGTPTANPDTATTAEDTPVTIPVLGNDTDPTGQPLTVTSADAPNGTVTVNPNGTITYTPDPNYNGPDTITYTVTDPDGNTSTSTVAVTVTPVNDAPEANPDTSTTPFNTPVTFAVLGNDTDVDGDTLTISGTPTSPNGTVTVNPNGTLTFTPTPGFTGAAVVNYTIVDEEGLTDTSTWTITVGSGAGTPTANPDTATTAEDTPVTIPVLGNDTDPTGQPLTVTSADAPNGTVTVNPNGTITYTPDPNYNGPDTITYTVTDPDGNTSTSTVAVTVTPVNDAPEANPDTSTTPFNTPVTFAILGNDTDVDGDTLTISGTPTSPNGTVTVNPNGTLTFTPTPGFTGAAVVNYTIVDEEGLTDTSTWTITVGADGVRDGIVRGTTGGDLIDAGYVDPFDADRVDANDALVPGEVGNDDIIEAGAGNDTVLAGEGNDDVRGDLGNDSINGNAGDDSVQGGLGDDSIFGDAGNDTLIGDAGNDEIVGGLGDDSILGGVGNDALQGNEGNDTLRGDAGDDDILGGAGDDLVAGGVGNDTILGGLGNDTVIGDDGNDTLQGNIGDDSILGGLGNDSIVGNEGNDTVDGGAGDDIIDTSGTAPLPDIDYPGAYPADTDPSNDRDLVTGGLGNDTILTGDDADTIIGGAGNDVIDAGVDADLVEGGLGNDIIVGSEGADTIDGGDGNDLIYGGLNDVLGEALDLPDAVDLRPDNNRDVLNGGAGDDTIFGRDDDDTLFGGAGNDVLDGGIDEDSLVGGAGNDTLTGGQGADSMAGGNDRDTFFVTVQAHGLNDVIDGNEGGDDFDTLDLRGSGPLSIVYDPTNPENGTVTFLDADRNPTGTLAFTNIENVVPCFTPGTLIATPKGEVPVEHLKVGDRVITRDNGIQEIRWMGQKQLGWRDLAANPHLKPVLIRQGSLGNGLPERDMMVSPNHRMLVANDRTALYFDEHEVLVSAKHLVAANGIQSIDSIGTTYLHFLFDRHEVVLGNGAWTESFQPGDLTLKGMGNAQRAEIFELFPELQTEAGQNDYQAARRTLKKHEARLLVK